MWVDDRSNDHDLPVNATATQLYGTGWPILGNAVVVTDDHRPLPPGLVHDLDPALTVGQEPEVAALDWDDHHRDRDPSPNVDIDPDDLDIAQGPITQAEMEAVREEYNWDIDNYPGDDPVAGMPAPTELELAYEAERDLQNEADAIHYHASEPDLDDGTDIDL